jgi:hypothetical protein
MFRRGLITEFIYAPGPRESHILSVGNADIAKSAEKNKTFWLSDEM